MFFKDLISVASILFYSVTQVHVPLSTFNEIRNEYFVREISRSHGEECEDVVW